jgi:hypothetical protein
MEFVHCHESLPTQAYDIRKPSTSP